MGIRIAAKSLERMKRKVRNLTRRSQGNAWEEIRDRLRRAVTGWVNYYALADARNHMVELDAVAATAHAPTRLESLEETAHPPATAQGAGCQRLLGACGRAVLA